MDFLKDLSTPQLNAIRQIILAGVPAVAQDNGDEGPYCHDSPPKGYPEDKSEYGDPECYRYPLNTRKRALAAWRYVHQSRNKEVLGDKWETVKNRIKKYAKEHYDLELDDASAGYEWERYFKEFYDSETSGEGFVASSEKVDGGDSMEKIEELQKELAEIKSLGEQKDSEIESLKSDKAELEEKASQLDSLTEEHNSLKEELESLREFKAKTEEAQQRAELLKARKDKVEEAGLEIDIEADADNWLAMSDDLFDFTLANMSKLAKSKKDDKDASASKMKVPQTSVSGNDSDNKAEEMLEFLKNKKNRGDR